MYILSPPPLRVFKVCDNPLCVRAEATAGSHLFLGDHSENMRERAAAAAAAEAATTANCTRRFVCLVDDTSAGL